MIHRPSGMTTSTTVRNHPSMIATDQPLREQLAIFPINMTVPTDDKNNSQINNKNKRKDKSNDNCTNNPKDNAHQCITRSDGAVRALRARTGDQHRTAFKIVTGGFRWS